MSFAARQKSSALRLTPCFGTLPRRGRSVRTVAKACADDMKARTEHYAGKLPLKNDWLTPASVREEDQSNPLSDDSKADT